MALVDLGSKLAKAITKLVSSTQLDDEAVKVFLNTTALALLQSDMDVNMVKQLQIDIRTRYVALDEQKIFNKRKLFNQIIEEELTKLVSSNKPLYKMEKGKKTHRVLFLGLQGAGKTTTCGKYAHYYKRKGWKVGIIAADTFRAGAYDQAKQNATRVGAYFFGKQDEKDPAVVVELGLQAFAEMKLDLIIVDTAGRHKQESALFEEMKAINSVFQADDTIFVMDASIGKSILEHAKAFADAVSIGSIILTKMDGSSKGGGALTAISQTKSPVSFIGIGEHMGDLQAFHPRSFIRRLLGGCGDLNQIMESVDENKLKELKTNIDSGSMNFENMRNQLEQVRNLGGISMVAQILPAGMISQGDKEQANQQFKLSMVIFDSMTKEELQGTDKLFHKQPQRILRIARGSGSSEESVRRLIGQFKKFEASQKQIKNLKGNGLQKMMNPRLFAQLSQL